MKERMKKNIITLVAISLSLSGCGIYTKYEPATVVPDDLYGGEVVTEDTAGLGNMDWRELFTDLICNPSLKWDCRPIPIISLPSSVWKKHRPY